MRLTQLEVENEDFVQPEAKIMEQEGETVQQDTLQHEEQVNQEVETEDQLSIMSVKEMLDVMTVDKEGGSYRALVVPHEASELEQSAMPSLTIKKSSIHVKPCSKICGRPKDSSKFCHQKLRRNVTLKQRVFNQIHR